MKTKMTTQSASRIQSAAFSNRFSKSFTKGFNARAQSSAAKGKGGWPSTNGSPSGGGRDNNPPGK